MQCPAGGRLTVETANVDLDEAYCRTHPDAHPGRYVMLSVTDTGTGMDETTLARIFEPFYTTKGPGAGTGLGLSTVYGIVKHSGWSHRGDLERSWGEVARFEVYLPEGRARYIAPFSWCSPAHDAFSSSDCTETILIVEDEEAIRSLATRILHGLGYTVLTAATADDACRMLSEVDTCIDLLLTDLVLPGTLQGDDLARYLQGTRPGTPVLCMSGYARDAFRHGEPLEGDANYLEKPFTRDGLIRKVREALDGARS